MHMPFLLYVLFIIILFLDDSLASTLYDNEDATVSEPVKANTAAREDSDVWLVFILCFVFCFAIRHANDFYAGETVTLVEEGVWGGRFRHRGEYKFLSHIERDFKDMLDQLKDKEDERLEKMNKLSKNGSETRFPDSGTSATTQDV